MLKPASAYVRASTDLQDGSVSQQKKEIANWAADNGYQLLRYYEDEGKSGTSFEKRPGFSLLKRDVEHRPDFSTVLVYDESRWSRTSPRESIYWKEHFRRFGVTVRVIHSRANGGDGFVNYVIEGIESEESGEYSRKLSRSTFRGQASNAREGFSCGGMAPFGYKRISVDPKTGKFIRDLPPGVRRRLHEEKVILALGDPVQVRLVKRIFKLQLDGNGILGIASILNREKVPCPRTGRWKNTNQMWSSGTISTILKNPAYYGARVFNRHPQSHLKGPEKAAWENSPDLWVIKENAHPAIISKVDWNLVNARYKPYERRNRYSLSSNYLLSGLLVCSNCGFKFHGITKRVKKNGIYKAGYYVDSGYHSKGSSVCVALLIRQDEVETKVIEAIGRVISRKEFLTEVTGAVDRRLSERRVRVQSEAAIKRKLSLNRKAQEGFFRLIEEGTEVESLRKRIEELEVERKQLEVQLKASQAVGPEHAKEHLEQVAALVKDFTTTFKQAKPHLQKSLIRRFVEKVVVDPKTRKVTIILKKIPKVNGFMDELAGGHKKVTFKLNGHNVLPKN